MNTKEARKTSGSAPRAQNVVVHFEFKDPAAHRVCIAGTFNDWHPEVSEMIELDPGHWVKDFELKPGAYEYRLVVDGRWTNDPMCLHTAPNGFGGSNSLLLVQVRTERGLHHTATSIAA